MSLKKKTNKEIFDELNKINNEKVETLVKEICEELNSKISLDHLSLEELRLCQLHLFTSTASCFLNFTPSHNLKLAKDTLIEGVENMYDSIKDLRDKEK